MKKTRVLVVKQVKRGCQSSVAVFVKLITAYVRHSSRACKEPVNLAGSQLTMAYNYDGIPSRPSSCYRIEAFVFYSLFTTPA